jgi:hypothetical protein
MCHSRKELKNPGSSSARYLRAAGFIWKPAAFILFSPDPRRGGFGGKRFLENWLD